MDAKEATTLEIATLADSMVFAIRHLSEEAEAADLGMVREAVHRIELAKSAAYAAVAAMRFGEGG